MSRSPPTHTTAVNLYRIVMTPKPARPPSSAVSAAGAAKTWSPAARAIASLVLLGYLFVVAMGPVTNPVSTEELTAPIARRLAPVHQLLFLGHGYRFFAPDPGPGHRVLVRTAGEPVSERHFPDTQTHWPRLMYHRWFMLSETLWNEFRSLPSDAEFNAAQARLSGEVERFKLAGHPDVAASLASLRDRNARGLAASRKRSALLSGGIQRELSRRMEKPVELLLQERLIPMPADILTGGKLSAPEYLMTPIPVTGPEEIR